MQSNLSIKNMTSKQVGVALTTLLLAGYLAGCDKV